MLVLQNVFSESVSMKFKRFRCHCKINFVTLSGIKNIWGREDNRWGSAHFKKINFLKKKLSIPKYLKASTGFTHKFIAVPL